MPVLLTRPLADSQRIAAELTGIETLTWPLTEIVPVDGATPPGAETDALIFTSANAVRFFAEVGTERALPALCVGPQTAQAAHEMGFQRVETGAGRASDLPDLVVRGGWRNLYYARGRKVSLNLAGILRERALTVVEGVFYGAEPGPPPESVVVDGLAAGSINLVTLWSRHAAALFADHVDTQRVKLHPKCTLLSISENVEDYLRTRNFSNVVSAMAPDASGMIAAIRASSVALRQ